MARYMIQFAYTPEAWATLTKKPQDRRIAVREAAQRLGGQVLDLYYCFGEYDGVVLFEAPDDISATAIALAAVGAGHLKASKTTRLFTVEETMEAMRKAGGVAFSGPSRGHD